MKIIDKVMSFFGYEPKQTDDEFYWKIEEMAKYNPFIHIDGYNMRQLQKNPDFITGVDDLKPKLDALDAEMKKLHKARMNRINTITNKPSAKLARKHIIEDFKQTIYEHGVKIGSYYESTEDALNKIIDGPSNYTRINPSNELINTYNLVHDDTNNPYRQPREKPEMFKTKPAFNTTYKLNGKTIE